MRTVVYLKVASLPNIERHGVIMKIYAGDGETFREYVRYMNAKMREIRQVYPIPIRVNIKWTGNDRSFAGWCLIELRYIDAWAWVRS